MSTWQIQEAVKPVKRSKMYIFMQSKLQNVQFKVIKICKDSLLVKTVYYAYHTLLSWCALNPPKKEQLGRTANFTLLQKIGIRCTVPIKTFPLY